MERVRHVVCWSPHLTQDTFLTLRSWSSGICLLSPLWDILGKGPRGRARNGDSAARGLEDFLLWYRRRRSCTRKGTGNDETTFGICLEPLIVLFFRDSRPFNAGCGDRRFYRSRKRLPVLYVRISGDNWGWTLMVLATQLRARRHRRTMLHQRWRPAVTTRTGLGCYHKTVDHGYATTTARSPIPLVSAPAVWPRLAKKCRWSGRALTIQSARTAGVECPCARMVPCGSWP